MLPVAAKALPNAAAFHVSLSLFEPPGTLIVTNRTCNCSHMTFSTYSASDGNSEILRGNTPVEVLQFDAGVARA